jgi:hypothetical protein
MKTENPTDIAIKAIEQKTENPTDIAIKAIEQKFN